MKSLSSAVTSYTEETAALPDPDVAIDIYTASMEDRRRVYGENVLPSKPSKTLLVLMWLALKDKVLVCAVCFHPVRLLIVHSTSYRLCCQ